MIDVSRAGNFVQERGDGLERARSKALLGGEAPEEPITATFSAIQDPGGGFSPAAGEPATVRDTVRVLTWLDDLRVREGDVVDRAFDFLIRHQGDDGGWHEAGGGGGKEAAPLFATGGIEDRVSLTAYCSHWFVRFGRAEPPGARGCPVRFLSGHLEPSGLLVGEPEATWDALVLFSYHPGEGSDLFTETLGAMEGTHTPDAWADPRLARLLCCLRDAGVPADHSLVGRCLGELCGRQREDGGWGSGGGPAGDVNATLEVLRGAVHYLLG